MNVSRHGVSWKLTFKIALDKYRAVSYFNPLLQNLVKLIDILDINCQHLVQDF